MVRCLWPGKDVHLTSEWTDSETSSFPQCYAHRFEPLIDNHQGVPLEHYISCRVDDRFSPSVNIPLLSLGIKDIQILAGQGVIKKVQFANSTTGICLPNASPPLELSNSNHSRAKRNWIDDEHVFQCMLISVPKFNNVCNSSLEMWSICWKIKATIAVYQYRNSSPVIISTSIDNVVSLITAFPKWSIC